MSPSTASVHLNRLKIAYRVKVLVQGKHRFYSLEGPDVANALEGLSVLAGAGGSREKFVPNTSRGLRAARACCDHMAGATGASLHDRFKALAWPSAVPNGNDNAYDLSLEGMAAFGALGMDIAATRRLRRRFACACLDWGERRPHVGAALGRLCLEIALEKKMGDPGSRTQALGAASLGRREMLTRFGLPV